MILLDPLARPIIGHRGASGTYPENTMVAFREAIAAGAHALEMDVRLTADAVPVVIHDATLDRTTDGTGLVSAMTADGLGGLDAGAGERIPRLSEVLEAFPETPILLEIKAPEAGPPAAAVLRRVGAVGRVVAGSYSCAAVRPLRQAGGASVACRWETACFWAASRVGHAFGGGSYEAFSVPLRSGRIRIVDRAFTGSARRRGKAVHVWTVDDPQRAAMLRAIGVNGIVTNFPERMRGVT